MAWLAALSADHVVMFTLVLARVSGLMMTAPIYGTQDIPMQVRALLSFSIAVLIAPTQIFTPVAEPGSLVHYAILMGGELLVGVVLGMGTMILFSGIQLAGEAIGRVSGEMLSDIFDPASGNNVPLHSHLLFLVALAVFVTIGGQRLVMAGLLETFKAVPPGRVVVPEGLSQLIVDLVTQSFQLGLRAAAPVLVALLLANIVLGLIGRTLPQLNILNVGFGLNSLLTFGTLIFSLGAAVWVFQGQVEPMLERVLETFGTDVPRGWIR